MTQNQSDCVIFVAECLFSVCLYNYLSKWRKGQLNIQNEYGVSRGGIWGKTKRQCFSTLFEICNSETPNLVAKEADKNINKYGIREMVGVRENPFEGWSA